MKYSMVAAAIIGSVVAAQHKGHVGFHARRGYPAAADSVCTVYTTVYETAPAPSVPAESSVHVNTPPAVKTTAPVPEASKPAYPAVPEHSGPANPEKPNTPTTPEGGKPGYPAGTPEASTSCTDEENKTPPTEVPGVPQSTPVIPEGGKGTPEAGKPEYPASTPEAGKPEYPAGTPQAGPPKSATAPVPEESTTCTEETATPTAGVPQSTPAVPEGGKPGYPAGTPEGGKPEHPASTPEGGKPGYPVGTPQAGPPQSATAPVPEESTTCTDEIATPTAGVPQNTPSVPEGGKPGYPAGTPSAGKPEQPATPTAGKPEQPATPEGGKPEYPAGTPQAGPPKSAPAPVPEVSTSCTDEIATPTAGVPQNTPSVPEGGKPEYPAGTPSAGKPEQPATPTAGKPEQPATPTAGKPEQPATPEGGKPSYPAGTPEAGKPEHPTETAVVGTPVYTPAPQPSKPAESPKPVPSSSKAVDQPKPSGSYDSTGHIKTNGDKWAITYTPYANDGQCKEKAEVQADIKKISELGFTTIRSYSTDCGVFENVVPECEKYGLKVIYGIFLEAGGKDGKGCFSEYANNQLKEITDSAPKDSVSMVIVGNECIFNGNCKADELASYIDHVRDELHNCGFPKDIAVTTTEPVGTWEENGDALCSHIDVFTAQIQPYFTQSVSAEDAGDFAAQQLEQASKVCPEAAKKGAYITEIGWPSAGQSNGQAHAGKEEQKVAMKKIMEKVGSQSCLFSFQNDGWKDPGSYNVEQNFGCVDALA